MRRSNQIVAEILDSMTKKAKKQFMENLQIVADGKGMPGKCLSVKSADPNSNG